MRQRGREVRKDVNKGRKGRKERKKEGGREKKERE